LLSLHTYVFVAAPLSTHNVGERAKTG